MKKYLHHTLTFSTHTMPTSILPIKKREIRKGRKRSTNSNSAMKLTKEQSNVIEDIRCILDLEHHIVQPFLLSEIDQLEEYSSMIEERILRVQCLQLNDKMLRDYLSLVVILFSSLFLNDYIIRRHGSENLKESLDCAYVSLETYHNTKDPEYQTIIERINSNLYFPPLLSL